MITPEAVLLELPTVGVATRMFARIIDLAFFGSVLSVLMEVLVFVPVFGNSSVLLGVLMAFLYMLALPIGIEILWKGQSLGKAIVGIRVVGIDGSPEVPRQAVIRGLVGLVDVFISVGFLAIVTAGVSQSSQRAGDLAAGTVVIRSRRGGHRLTPIAFHPPVGYENYVATLDVGRLDDADFTLIREFLLRVKELTPVARAQLATGLAEQTLEKIQHILPGTIDPELWLVCVASAYQTRQGGLLADAALGLAPLAPV